MDPINEEELKRSQRAKQYKQYQDYMDAADKSEKKERVQDTATGEMSGKAIKLISQDPTMDTIFKRSMRRG